MLLNFLCLTPFAVCVCLITIKSRKEKKLKKKKDFALRHISPDFILSQKKELSGNNISTLLPSSLRDPGHHQYLPKEPSRLASPF